MFQIIYTFGFIVSAFLYFLPTIIGRKKSNFTSIFLVNLLLGWSLIGWIVAIVMATSKDPSSNALSANSKTVVYTCKYCKFVSKTNSDFCPACDLDDLGNTKEFYKEKIKTS